MTTFYAPGEWSGEHVLDAQASHHANVKRLAVGDAVQLSSGSGRLARGVIAGMSRAGTIIHVDMASVEHRERRMRIELWAPVGDKERTLWLAEKTAELGVAAWQPVVYARSKSVATRAEGPAFLEKVKMRHIAALEQSGSAWLPEMHAELSASEALLMPAQGTQIVLNVDGIPMIRLVTDATPVRIALGPEGGLTDEEVEAFDRTGWHRVSLGRNILRFETAAIAAISAVLTLQS